MYLHIYPKKHFVKLNIIKTKSVYSLKEKLKDSRTH